MNKRAADRGWSCRRIPTTPRLVFVWSVLSPTMPKDTPLRLELPDGLPVQGVVLADHVKSADWQGRGSDYIATVPAEVLEEVRAKLKPLLGM